MGSKGSFKGMKGHAQAKDDAWWDNERRILKNMMDAGYIKGPDGKKKKKNPKLLKHLEEERIKKTPGKTLPKKFTNPEVYENKAVRTAAKAKNKIKRTLPKSPVGVMVAFAAELGLRWATMSAAEKKELRAKRDAREKKQQGSFPQAIPKSVRGRLKVKKARGGPVGKKQYAYGGGVRKTKLSDY